jgi:hypothetical protein
LGEGYETAAEEVKAYQEAIESGSGVAAAEAALKNAILLGETAKDFGVNAEELEKLTGEIMANSNANFETALN